MFLNFKNATKKQKTFMENVFWFAKNELLPRHKNLEINVIMEKDSDLDGCVYECDDREYEMTIKKELTGDDLITCIFHEFKHIEQDIRKRYDIHVINDVPYMERPYEIEAFEAQEKMLKKYKKTVALS